MYYDIYESQICGNLNIIEISAGNLLRFAKYNFLFCVRDSKWALFKKTLNEDEVNFAQYTWGDENLKECHEWSHEVFEHFIYLPSIEPSIFEIFWLNYSIYYWYECIMNVVKSFEMKFTQKSSAIKLDSHIIDHWWKK